VDLAVRTAADPKLLVNAVRAALRGVDPINRWAGGHHG